MNRQQIACGLLSLSLAASLSAPVFAVDRTQPVIAARPTEAVALNSFSDVPASFWAHEAIMTMVQMGMVGGTVSPNAEGVGQFAPNAPMTRAQFIAIVTRYLYPDAIPAMKAQLGDCLWFEPNYQVAVEQGLITGQEFIHNGLTGKDNPMNAPMSRQEMAMVLVRAAEVRGEDMTDKITQETIADFETIASPYREYVRSAYKAGLIAGVDQDGTFLPQGTLSRAQASMVLYRLVMPAARIPGVDKVVTPAVGGQVFREGENHSIPKVGDVVIRADGTRIVLKEKWGVVGADQRVDIWTGTKIGQNTVRVGGTYPEINLRPFRKSELTGEVFNVQEWVTIATYSDPTGKYKASYDGEVYNTYWQWDAGMDMWCWLGEG